MKKGASRLARETRRVWPVFLLPTLAAFCLLFLRPFLSGVFLSFFSFRSLSAKEFVGFANYAAAFGDPSFLRAFGLTLVFAAVCLVAVNLPAFFLALALTGKTPLKKLFRTAFFLPNLVGGIVLGYIWSTIFEGLLLPLGKSILLDGNLGFWGLVILFCWQQVGYVMIIYIAGLEAVDESLYEAARMDGAGKGQILRFVTLPTLLPQLAICFFLTLTGAFKLFDQNLALTDGRPFLQVGEEVVKTTELLALNIVNSFYASNASRGVGQAKAVLFFLAVSLIGLVQLAR